MSARDRLIREIGPAVAFTRVQAAADDATDVDFDSSRRLWLARMTGSREDGVPLPGATLEEGQAVSLPALRQWQAQLTGLLENLERNPAAYGARLRDYEEV